MIVLGKLSTNMETMHSSPSRLCPYLRRVFRWGCGTSRKGRLNPSALRSPHIPGDKAFTLTEMVVALGVIFLLASLLLPSTQKILEDAKRSKCAGGLRQIGVAALQYASENDGTLPTTAGTSLGKNNSVAPGLIDLLGPYASGGERIFYCPDSIVSFSEVASAPGNQRFREIGYYWTLATWFPFHFPANVPMKTTNISPTKGVLAMCLHFSGLPVHSNKMNVLFADGHTEQRKGNPQGVLLPYVDPANFELKTEF
jgi:prepilin-type processing-associated H-X9-DG protein